MHPSTLLLQEKHMLSNWSQPFILDTLNGNFKEWGLLNLIKQKELYK